MEAYDGSDGSISMGLVAKIFFDKEVDRVMGLLGESRMDGVLYDRLCIKRYKNYYEIEDFTYVFVDVCLYNPATGSGGWERKSVPFPRFYRGRKLPEILELVRFSMLGDAPEVDIEEIKALYLSLFCDQFKEEELREVYPQYEMVLVDGPFGS